MTAWHVHHRGHLTAAEHPDCIARQILTGARTPTDCAAYFNAGRSRTAAPTSGGSW